MLLPPACVGPPGHLASMQVRTGRPSWPAEPALAQATRRHPGWPPPSPHLTLSSEPPGVPFLHSTLLAVRTPGLLPVTSTNQFVSPSGGHTAISHTVGVHEPRDLWENF